MKKPPKSGMLPIGTKSGFRKWKPTKGGDGGDAQVTISFEEFVAHKSANAKRVLVCATSNDMEATQDPFDRSHTLKDGAYWRPAARKHGNKIVVEDIPGARAREYPEPQMVTRWDATYTNEYRVAADSSFDWLEEAQKRLAGIRGIGKRDNAPVSESIHVKMALIATGREDRPHEAIRTIVRGSRAEEWNLKGNEPWVKEDLNHERMVKKFLKNAPRPSTSN
jgi:hypothetical protein